MDVSAANIGKRRSQSTYRAGRNGREVLSERKGGEGEEQRDGADELHFAELLVVEVAQDVTEFRRLLEAQDECRSSGKPFFTCTFVRSQVTDDDVEKGGCEGSHSLLKESIRATSADHGNCRYPHTKYGTGAQGAMLPSLSWWFCFCPCSPHVGY